MGVKQEREETLGSFVDRLAEAINKAGVPDWMKVHLIKQCVIQNSSPGIQKLIATLPGNWGLEELLERAAMIPTGSQVLLVDAIKEVGSGLQKQAEATQSQVLAALAPLQASAAFKSSGPSKSLVKCYRCGGGGHICLACKATGIWCQTCQSDTHNTSTCRRKSGNQKASATGRAMA